jgi:hypothetical protein
MSPRSARPRRRNGPSDESAVKEFVAVTHLDSGTRFRRRDVRINIGFLELVSDVAVSVTAVYTATDLTSTGVSTDVRGIPPAGVEPAARFSLAKAGRASAQQRRTE